MKTLPPALAASLAGGATTLCHCWRVTRTDGVAYGFTDHDRDILFDGTTFRAAGGLEGSALETATGLGVDNATFSGALSADGLSDEDLSAGRFDGAGVEFWRVDWRDADARLLLKRGTLGEVRRGPHAFEAELRGAAADLEAPVGRVYQRDCDADLGDARCTVDLDTALFRSAGAVTEVVSRARFRVSGLDGYEAGWFANGFLVWSDGANAGLTAHIGAHSASRGDVELALRAPAPAGIGVGDGFVMTAGCDKRFGTCRDKFQNTLNFRGFHLMPGDDFVTGYPATGDPLDGGRRG